MSRNPDPDAPEPSVTDLLETVPLQARHVYRRFRQYVELADLIQEGYAYVLKHAEALLERETWMVETRVRQHCDRYARREKSYKVGYRVGDEFFYSHGHRKNVQFLADLLPYALADEWELQPQFVEEAERVSGGRAASEGWNWPVLLADVSAAFNRLDAEPQAVLRARFGGRGKTLSELGQVYGVASQRASEMVVQALSCLLEDLGGVSPWQ